MRICSMCAIKLQANDKIQKLLPFNDFWLGCEKCHIGHSSFEVELKDEADSGERNNS